MAKDAGRAAESTFFLLVLHAWYVMLLYVLHEQGFVCGDVSTLEANVLIFTKNHMVESAFTIELAVTVGEVSAWLECFVVFTNMLRQVFLIVEHHSAAVAFVALLLWFHLHIFSSLKLWLFPFYHLHRLLVFESAETFILALPSMSAVLGAWVLLLPVLQQFWVVPELFYAESAGEVFAVLTFALPILTAEVAHHFIRVLDGLLHSVFFFFMGFQLSFRLENTFTLVTGENLVKQSFYHL